MPLSNKRRKPRLLRHAGMQEFFLFEPFLILPNDARSPGPCADFAPAKRVDRRAAGSGAVGFEKPTTPQHYWEVVARKAAERYWAIRP
jgi:hypothetical protein